jgi:hypothetical protein
MLAVGCTGARIRWSLLLLMRRLAMVSLAVLRLVAAIVSTIYENSPFHYPVFKRLQPELGSILKGVSALGLKLSASVRSEAKGDLSSFREAKGRKCCLLRCDTFEQTPGVDRKPTSLLR